MVSKPSSSLLKQSSCCITSHKQWHSSQFTAGNQLSLNLRQLDWNMTEVWLYDHATSGLQITSSQGRAPCSSILLDSVGLSYIIRLRVPLPAPLKPVLDALVSVESIFQTTPTGRSQKDFNCRASASSSIFNAMGRPTWQALHGSPWVQCTSSPHN
ncbi:hypothetical protein H0G86_000422 [Trichoderma simmonsii]|uniref:Uncharacterized protein n=1 Tax=Trichoderma simmonsii TaxID=1491479 RepID=A0A8G0PDX9_9HYPO|nr:hypothetical protein H0G86_000422 [Trichoderma simmonsii]